MISSWWDVGLFFAALVVAFVTIVAFYKLDPRSFGERALYFIGFSLVLLGAVFVGYRLNEEGVTAEVREWMFGIFLSLIIFAQILSKDE